MALNCRTLVVEQEGPILWVRINRSAAMNAYTATMGAELAAAFDYVDGEDSIRVVILSALGRVFCAGADVSAGAGAFDTDSGEGAKNFGGRSEGRNANFIAAIMNCRKPSIVAFNGSAAGVGLTLTLACDIRIAADNAKFGCVFTRRGLVPEAGSAWFLPQIVGLSQALKWCLTGALVPASEALEKGLLTEICPAEQLDQRARELATEIAANTRRLRSRSPAACYGAIRLTPALRALSVDALLNIELGKGADVYEGVSAFLEKRAPRIPEQSFKRYASNTLVAGRPNESLRISAIE